MLPNHMIMLNYIPPTNNGDARLVKFEKLTKTETEVGGWFFFSFPSFTIFLMRDDKLTELSKKKTH